MFKIFSKEGFISYLPENSSEIKKSKILLKPLLIDLSIAFIIVSIVSVAYILVGKFLLAPQEILPSDVNLIKEQARIFTTWAIWLEPLYKISVFFALFGTIYAGFEAATRMLHETSKNVMKVVNKISYIRFMAYFMLYILIIGIPLAILAYKGLSIITMLSVTLLFIGVIGVLIYGIGTVYFTQKILPKGYRLNYFNLGIVIFFTLLMLLPLFLIFF
jgi:hypothetical protein